MKEKLPKVLEEQLMNIVLSSKEGNLILTSYLIGKGFEIGAKPKITAEFTIEVNNEPNTA